jgi:hypothetical protein
MNAFVVSGFISATPNWWKWRSAQDIATAGEFAT